MSAAKKAPAPPKVRAGRCSATGRCGCCRNVGPCRCEAFEFGRQVDGWAQCVCGHTRQVHALIEKTAAA